MKVSGLISMLQDSLRAFGRKDVYLTMATDSFSSALVPFGDWALTESTNVLVLCPADKDADVYLVSTVLKALKALRKNMGDLQVLMFSHNDFHEIHCAYVEYDPDGYLEYDPAFYAKSNGYYPMVLIPDLEPDDAPPANYPGYARPAPTDYDYSDWYDVFEKVMEGIFYDIRHDGYTDPHCFPVKDRLGRLNLTH